MYRKPIASGIVLLFIVSSLIPMVSSDTYSSKVIIYVDDVPGSGLDNPTEDYTRIQYAIDNASDGDTIFVYGGIYTELINVDKSLV